MSYAAIRPFRFHSALELMYARTHVPQWVAELEHKHAMSGVCEHTQTLLHGVAQSHMHSHELTSFDAQA